MNKGLKTTHEMKDSGIEWIGEVPINWQLPLLGTHFKERSEKVSDKEFPPLSVTKQGIVPQLENVAKTDHNDDRKKICINDFVINSRSDRKGSSGLSKYEGSTSNISIVLELRDIFPMYAHYLLKSYGFVEEFYRWGNGIVADLWSTRYSSMKKINIPLPPVQEQKAIADFLDEECSKIDKLIADEKQAIEKWKEYKQSLITEIVSKGLNPDVEMKDSGIDWIGEIPNEWELKKGKYLFKQSMKKGGKHLIQLAATQAYGVVPQSFLESVVKISLDTDLATFKEVKINDFVISLRSFQGGFEIAKYNGVITPAYTVFRSSTCIHHNYFKYLFKAPSFISKINSITVGIREGKDIKYKDFSQMPLPIPPLSEQKAIADFLDERCAKIDETITQKQQLIQQLEEYKQSLIYECVTGKKQII